MNLVVLTGLHLAVTMLCSILLLYKMLSTEQNKSTIIWAIVLGVLIIVNSVCFSISLCDAIVMLIK